ncbi:DUF1003 domain-containing protein [Ciceribacter sp. L1K22]|uniref:DUF1003 domain-containing protein n=1 Tax=Ciceribacter sp. L1K22 TaxID=2820275 RepID=UPI001ABDF224|nr:DUF1003 domain-containing protein [Ciceribacter sp. L1K22]MBO3760236.1 DUF1003 domain-containing protein [Ciceribacter sp. L1K22]
MVEIGQKLLGKTAEQLSAVERRVLKKARERRIVSADAHEDFLATATLGQRLADGIARVGGSWSFIFAFIAFLVIWALANTIFLTKDAPDPYPFIFLNLLLSMVAAIQAPIIMMSQNRQAERDRFMAARDYEINLKAEIEVLALHDKIDIEVLVELRDARKQIDLLMEEVRKLSERLETR